MPSSYFGGGRGQFKLVLASYWLRDFGIRVDILDGPRFR
jgi:hypothetical protein